MWASNRFVLRSISWFRIYVVDSEVYGWRQHRLKGSSEKTLICYRERFEDTRLYQHTTLQYKQVLLPQSTHSGASLIQGRGASLIAPLVGNRVNHSLQPYTNLSLHLTLKLILLSAYFPLVSDDFSLFFCLAFREQYYTRKEEIYFVCYRQQLSLGWVLACYSVSYCKFIFSSPS